jgi:hypothetical protein
LELGVPAREPELKEFMERPELEFPENERFGADEKWFGELE